MKYLLLLTILCAVACTRIQPTNENTAVFAPIEFAKTAPQPTPAPKVWDGLTPDTNLTPGDTLDVKKEDVCVRGYSKKIRNVPESVKQQVYKEYGITSHKPGEYEVDHLISLELGGSNSIKNLWAESYVTKPWNAHTKDALEDRLHAMVCRGDITLAEAQAEIRGDWRIAYRKYFGEPK